MRIGRKPGSIGRREALSPVSELLIAEGSPDRGGQIDTLRGLLGADSRPELPNPKGGHEALQVVWKEQQGHTSRERGRHRAGSSMADREGGLLQRGAERDGLWGEVDVRHGQSAPLLGAQTGDEGGHAGSDPSEPASERGQVRRGGWKVDQDASPRPRGPPRRYAAVEGEGRAHIDRAGLTLRVMVELPTGPQHSVVDRTEICEGGLPVLTQASLRQPLLDRCERALLDLLKLAGLGRDPRPERGRG